HRLVDGAQEVEELLMAMAGLALSEDRAIEHIEGRKQRRRSMAHIVVRDALDVSKAHRQKRMRALEGLALALLVDAQHQGVLRRTQVKANDVAQLLDEERIGRELEGLAAMRLKPEELEVAMNARGRDLRLGGHGTHA